ncbi:MAG: aminotransferase class III-fold pyridoxal phosphate-dependent enzyme [Deltaproteobacteria bacterium]
MSETEKNIKEFAAHSFGTWNRQKAWTTPLLIKDAEGIYMYDDKGKKYIDFSSQLMCSNLGHKNKAIIEAIVKQAEKLPYVAPGFANEASMEAVEALRSIMPTGLEKFFFSTSGTEANEAALKLVRQSKSPAYLPETRGDGLRSRPGARSKAFVSLLTATAIAVPSVWSTPVATCSARGSWTI